MQRPAAAVAEQHELARIEAVLDRDLLDGTGHDHGRERDDAVGHLYEALGPRIAAGADAAANRSRLDETHRLPAGALDGKESAVRAHHIKRSIEALGFEVALEAPDVAVHLRPHIGVGGRRRGALVFVPLARD